MELLQNQNYKFEELTINYLHEVQLQIESVIELCREGEICVHDAERIISNEYFSSVKYQHELWEKLNNYDIENDFTVSPEGNKILGIKAAFSDLIKNDLQNLIDKLSDYIAFLSGITVNNKLSEILLTDDYQKKRKTKIKSNIENVDASSIDIKPIQEISEQETAKPLIIDINSGMHLLFIDFPEFKKDYELLSNKEYIKKRGDGLHWEKDDIALCDYFRSIKPDNMKKINWKTLEKIFSIDNLKRASSFQSKDFIDWLEIKKNASSKQTAEEKRKPLVTKKT